MKVKITIDVKPFSANAMWIKRGRAVLPSPKYRDWTNEMLDVLSPHTWPFEAKTMLIFNIIAGLSNVQSDLDNVLKPTLDVFQKAYPDFNDRYVHKIIAEKIKVKKGSEYMTLEIERYKDEET